MSPTLTVLHKVWVVRRSHKKRDRSKEWMDFFCILGREKLTRSGIQRKTPFGVLLVPFPGENPEVDPELFGKILKPLLPGFLDFPEEQEIVAADV